MAAYVVALIKVTDEEAYGKYKELVPGSIAKYGGRYLARGGVHEVLEGDVEAGRVVVVEFESLEKAKEWFDSPEYGEAKPHRHRGSESRMVVVEGVP